MNLRADEEILRMKIRDEQRALSRDYYGDVVRVLLVITSVIILLLLPFSYINIPIPIFVPIGGIVASALAAGFTNAKYRWSLIFDTTVSGLGLVLNEYFAVMEYQASDTSVAFLLVTQALSILYFFALYYSVQTLKKWMK